MYHSYIYGTRACIMNRPRMSGKEEMSVPIATMGITNKALLQLEFEPPYNEISEVVHRSAD